MSASEAERLQALGAEVQNARGDAESRLAETKHALETLRATVTELAEELSKDRRTPRSNTYSTGYNDGYHDARVETGHRLRTLTTEASK